VIGDDALFNMMIATMKDQNEAQKEHEHYHFQYTDSTMTLSTTKWGTVQQHNWLQWYTVKKIIIHYLKLQLRKTDVGKANGRNWKCMVSLCGTRCKVKLFVQHEYYLQQRSNWTEWNISITARMWSKQRENQTWTKQIWSFEFHKLTDDTKRLTAH